MPKLDGSASWACALNDRLKAARATSARLKLDMFVPLIPVAALLAAGIKSAVAVELIQRKAKASLFSLGKESLRLERRHTSHASGGHGLAENVVGDIASRKNAGDRGRGRIGRGHEVAA